MFRLIRDGDNSRNAKLSSQIIVHFSSTVYNAGSTEREVSALLNPILIKPITVALIIARFAWF